ncbi:hypothetical protein C8J56DRAFT_937450 [Mycena floridula]|nr:hypothetical protein C8J56DRAFT_937450 [Mycena floridula]
MFRISLVVSVFLVWLSPVEAAHSVVMQNLCGTGVPTLDQLPSIVLNTGTSTYTNETINAVAFLNTGVCGPNGGHCTAVDIELGTLPDGSSTALIDLVPTHEFTVPVSFVYFNGCDGASQTCRNAGCPNAGNSGFLTQGIVQCTAPEASLTIIFCPDSATSSSSEEGGTTVSPASSAAAIGSPGGTTTTTKTSQETFDPSSSVQSSSIQSSSFQSSTTIEAPLSSRPSVITSSVAAPSSTSSSSSSSSVAAATNASKSSTGAIAGGVVGGILAAAILAGLGFFCWRKKRREDELLNPPQPAYDTEASWAAQPRPPMSPTVTPYMMSQTTAPTEKSEREFSPVRRESMTSGASTTRTGTVAPTVASQRSQPSETSQPSLDQIIEGLANRFGWTRPSVSGEAPPGYGEPGFVGHHNL